MNALTSKGVRYPALMACLLCLKSSSGIFYKCKARCSIFLMQQGMIARNSCLIFSQATSLPESNKEILGNLSGCEYGMTGVLLDASEKMALFRTVSVKWPKYRRFFGQSADFS